jgi:CheY-like chemotaxis protein
MRPGVGHEVVSVGDAKEALERVQTFKPEVAILDIGLPGMDGYEVARRIRASSGSRVRLVAVSGYAQPDDVASAMAAGFDAHVAKPADPDRIASLLE